MTFEQACIAVAQDWRELAQAIRDEDAYASHVTEAEKDAARDKMVLQADEIEQGRVKSFTIAQRIQVKMLGRCTALLPY